MWKNNLGYKSLAKRHFVVYKITGLNQDRLLNYLIKRGVEFYNVKKFSPKKMIISLPASQTEKFFAISKELCYNIKRIRYSGKTYPIYSFFVRIGLVLGLVFFITFSVLLNDFVFSIDYYGSGIKHKSEVAQFLEGNGIAPYCRFSSFSTSELEDKILASNKNLSFVSCEKVGNRLKINLISSPKKEEIITGKASKLISNVAGEIESIKVYRGTAVVSVGDKVLPSAVLVDGYAVVKDQMIKVNVIATVSIKVKREYLYISKNKGEEDKASAFALGEIDDESIIKEKTTCKFDGKNYNYKTEIIFRHVIFAG